MDSELGDRGLAVSESATDVHGRGDNNIAHRPLSYTEYFEKACPIFMAMGMSYELFWHGEPEAAVMYKRAYRLKQSVANEQAWLQGAYFYDALVAVAPYLRAFTKVKKPEPYIEKPFGADQEAEKSKVEERGINANDQRAKTVMEIFSVGFNKRFAGEQSKKL